MTNNTSKRKNSKSKIIHSHCGYIENGRPTKEYQLVRKTADSIFNSTSTAKPTITFTPATEPTKMGRK